MIEQFSDFTAPFITDVITNIMQETNNTIKYSETQYKREHGLESTDSGTGYLLRLMAKPCKYTWNDFNHTQIKSIKTTSMEDVSTRVLEKIKNI